MPDQVFLNESQKQKVIDALTTVGAVKPCPRCDNPTFATADTAFARPLQTSLPQILIAGSYVVTVAVFCTNCGFLSEHAIGVLGLTIADLQLESLHIRE